jgi:uncharacterized membrane protein YhaH (DUF805 family)
MFATLFKELKDARLKGLPYFGYSLLISLIFLIALILVGILIGMGESLIGGDVLQAQEKLRDWGTIPFFLLLGIFLLLVLFSSTNITAKRLRDIGLPAWPIAIMLTLLGILPNFIGLSWINFIYLTCWLVLIFLPSNLFQAKT